MYILGMDTSTDLLSVAVGTKQQIVGSINEISTKQHGETLLPQVESLLQAHSIAPQQIEAIIIGMGPGSYTGLRIGMTAAKMWGSSLQVPVYPVSSLALMAASVKDLSAKDVVIPLMDARRLSAYIGMYQWQQTQLVALQDDQHVDFASWVAEQGERLKSAERVILVGYQIEPFADYLREQLPMLKLEVIDDIQSLPHIERAFNFTLEAVSDIELLAPNYTQKTLAEREWQEKAENHEAYIELVETTIQ